MLGLKHTGNIGPEQSSLFPEWFGLFPNYSRKYFFDCVNGNTRTRKHTPNKDSSCSKRGEKGGELYLSNTDRWTRVDHDAVIM